MEVALERQNNLAIAQLSKERITLQEDGALTKTLGAGVFVVRCNIKYIRLV